MEKERYFFNPPLLGEDGAHGGVGSRRRSLLPALLCGRLTTTSWATHHYVRQDSQQQSGKQPLPALFPAFISHHIILHNVQSPQNFHFDPSLKIIF